MLPTFAVTLYGDTSFVVALALCLSGLGSGVIVTHAASGAPVGEPRANANSPRNAMTEYNMM
uniref:Uncharacterized protein n=1 Tax=Ciona intestinalis TaxID=7719 RepID=H2Y3T0_CIOIN